MANKTLPKTNDIDQPKKLDLRDYNFDGLTILSKEGEKQVQDKRYEVYGNIMKILLSE